MCAALTSSGASAQQIIPDGRTATSLAVQGNVTGVTTATQRGANAFNSFSRFNVDAGNVVNLMVPGSATNLINLVRDSATSVHGILNSVRDGRIGGNVYFANPHGFIVSATGIVNVGSLHVSTPTQGFVDSFFLAPGNPDDAAVAHLLAGTAPRSGTGLISIQGRVNALDGIHLSAGTINVAGTLYSGARFVGSAPDFGDVVNANGLNAGTNIVVKEGRVQIVADNDVTVSGTIAAPGGAGVRGGEVSITAGGNVDLVAGANVVARGDGPNSAGGTIRIWGDNNATFAQHATLDARGGTSGDGGFIELSARNKVTLAGGELKAGAQQGRAGRILIDPDDIEVVSVNQFTDGADFSLVANDSITVNGGVIISTRNLANVTTDDHLTALSQGPSGSLTLQASHIVLGNGAKLLAHGGNGHEGGDVKVEAFHLNSIGAVRNASASLKAQNATITGRNVTLSATAETSGLVQLLAQTPNISLQDAQKFIDNEADNLSDGPGGEQYAIKTEATAKVELYGVKVEGSGAIKIEAKAAGRAGFEKKASADVIVGDLLAADGTTVLATTRIQGGSVNISSVSDTSLTFNVLGNALRLADQSWLPDPDSTGVQTLNDQLFDFSEVPLVSLSTSTARTLLSGGSIVGATDTATLSSEGVSAAKPTFSSPFLFSAAWGESTVTAQTSVGGTTQLTAANKATVKAATDAEVNVTADVNSTNKPIDAVFVRARNTATTTAELGANTTTTAGSVDVTANTRADIAAGATARNAGGSGVGIAVAVNESSTTTTATVSGTVTATAGAVKVDATTGILKNNTSAEAATLGNPNTLSAKMTNFQAGIQRNVVGGILGATGKVSQATSDRLTGFMFPGIKEGKFNASGAVSYIDSENVATASIAPNATVKAEGDLSVTSRINDRPNASVGAKATSTGTAIGGSVILAGFTNTANAYIGANATVDAKGATLIDAQTAVPYPWQIDWTSPAVILNHLQGSILDLVLTSYAINSASGKDGVGLAAAVSVFGLENNSNAYIDAGAKVNTVFDKDTTVLPNQSVTVHAKNEVNTVNAVGILSKKFLGTSGGKAAIGGSANVIDIVGNASATIRGNAQVKSENGVDVKAESYNQLVTVTEAGGSSDKVGIEGALSMNTIANTVTAAIDDDARVSAGGNLKVEAVGDIETISVAGGVVATKGPVGIGMSVSLNTLTANTSAFIGNYDPLMTDTVPATGTIAVGGNLTAKATSDTEIGAYSVAGALATSSSSQTETPAGAQETQDGAGSAGGASGAGKGKFGIAVSGDASVNTITSDTLAYIADGATVSQAGNTALDASNALAINALAGAVTISTQQEGNSLAGSYAQNTLGGTTAAFVSDANLTLSGNLGIDAGVSGEINTLSASIAGTKGKLGVAGSVSINEITNLTRAYVARSAIHQVQSLSLLAHDDSSIKSIAGAIAFGGKAGVGLSFAWNKLDNDTRAYIEESDAAAAQAITVSAVTDNSIDTISAAIGASKGNMAAAGAVSVNTISNTTDAYVSGKKTAAGVDATGTIAFDARDDSRIFAVAGSFAAATNQAGVGVSFAWSDVGNTVGAGIRGAADVQSTAGDVEVKADSSTEIEAIAAGGGVANKVGIAGSVSVVQATNTVKAGIEDASKAIADGNVLVTSDDDVRIFSLAGNVALGGKAAIGVSNSTLVTDNTVEAVIAGSTQVAASANRAADAVYSGARDGNGNRTTALIKGVVVSATSHENIQTIAAGGSGAGKVGVAGSATVTVLDETTTATIGAGARVNENTAAAAGDQSVLVRASDQTTLMGIAGAVAFGGSAGVGAGADVGIITKTTEAAIASSAASPTLVHAKHSVVVDARNTEDILSIAASLSAGGSAGVAGSASVYSLTNITTAAIGASALVRSGGNVVVSADNATALDMIAGNAAFGGSAGVGASAGVSLIDKTTTATIGANADVTALGNATGVDVANGGFGVSFVANSGDEGEVKAPNASPDGSDSQAIGAQRVASRNTTNIKGVAVTATNRDDIESISATGAIGGSAAVTLAGNVGIVTTNTTASIADGAQINQSNAGAGAEQSVFVAAGNDHYHMGVAGSASGSGAVGVGVGADVLIASHNTRALVGASADVRARRDVHVVAAGQQEILSISAGLGVSGTVGVAGSAAVISVRNLTQALSGSASVIDADGNVRIAASDQTETDLIVGTVAIGLGAAGVGGSVGVTTISKNTTAGVGDGATINARGNDTGSMTAYSGESLTGAAAIKGLSVEATSSEDVFAVAAAGAGGFYAGVAGAVTVQTIDSNTTAAIGANADINKGVTDGNALQDVSVGARNSVKLQVGTGALGIGIAGVAGGVDVATIRNDTSASIGNGAEVFARQDVDVKALSVTDLDSIVVSAGGGIVGVAGAVAVYSVGSGLDQESKSRLATSGEFSDVNSYADDQAADGSVGSLLGGSSDARLRSVSSQAQTKRSAVSVSGELAPGAPSGTSAFVGSATVQAGRNVDVDARQQVNVDVITGALAVGAVGLGVGVGVVNVNTVNQAFITGGANVSAVGDVMLTAFSGTNGNVDAYVGSGGVVAVDAGVAIYNDNTVTAAYIGDGAQVVSADAVALDAIDRRIVNAHAFGASIGAAAAGASVATADIGGSVSARIGAGAQIGQSTGQVNDLFITADSEATAESDAEAAKAGLGLAAGGASSTATADALVTASIGNGAGVKVQNGVAVDATAKVSADAKALGVNVSLGGSVGASVALAEAAPQVGASIGSNATIEADSVAVSAAQAILGAGTRGHATGASGGLLLGANATVATAQSTGRVDAAIGANSTLTVSGTTRVSADNRSRQSSSAEGLSFGLLALGANISRANSNTLTQATLADGVRMTGGALELIASGNDDNLAYALAGSGGAVSGLASAATTSNLSQTFARTGSGTQARAIDVGTLLIDAGHTARFNSQVDSTNASLVGASGAAATNTVNSTTDARIGASGYVLADNIVMRAHNESRKDWLADWNVKSGSGGLLDLPAATGTTIIVNNALVQVGANAHVEQTGNRNNPGAYTLDAWNDVRARDKVTMTSGGAIAVPRAVSRILADVNNATVRVENGAEMTSVGDMAMGARSLADVYAQVGVDTYGVAGAPDGESVARFQAVNRIEIGDAKLESLNDINLGAGRNTAGQSNNIAATARTDLYNNTAIPLSADPTADAIIGTQSVISVGAGADVGAVRHVTLLAEEGTANASGVGIGKDLYREALAEAASAISNAFGGGDVSFETRSGRSIKNQTSEVTVDGEVRVGIHRKQDLVIGMDGSATSRTDGISILSTDFKDVAGDILARINALEDLIRQYTVDNPNSDASIAVAAYESEIRFLERKLDELGFPRQPGQGGFSGAARLSPLQTAQQAVTGINGTITDKIDEKQRLQTRNTTLTTLNGMLTSQNSTLATEITGLQAQQAALDKNAAGYQAAFDSLQTQITAKQNQISSNDTQKTANTATIASNTTTIGQLDTGIADLNLQKASIQDDIDNNRLSNVAFGGPVAKFLTISDVLARLGNIYVRGDRLKGTGKLDAPGDAEIKITNNGPNFLILKNLEIPPDDGGKVYFNSVETRNNAQINAINGALGGAAFTVSTAESQTDTAGNPVPPAKPQILITSNYDPLDPAYKNATPAGTPTLAPDIVLQGDVSNLRGLVKIDSAGGSIRLEQKRDANGNLIPGETATVRAGEVEIKTRNGDFVQSYTNTFFHTAGAPLVTVPGSSNLAFPGNISRIDRTPEQPGTGIVANGSVLIAARYLNINGNIQSGIPEWGVSIPASSTVQIGGGSGTFAQAQAHYANLSPAQKAVLGAEYYNVSGATVTGLAGNMQGSWEKINVRYNAKENRLELAGVQVQGGYIEIFGQIFNTNKDGGGKLRVLDGYGQIKVDNQTALPMWVNTLDTGRGVKGEIHVTNITGLNANGSPIITTTSYTRDPGDARTGNAFFDPAAGLRYTVTVGYDEGREDYYRYSQSGWFGTAILGSKALDQYRINSIVRANDPLSAGEFLQIAPGGGHYSPASRAQYNAGNPGSITGGRQERVSTAPDKVNPGHSWRDCNWWTLCINATHYQEFTVTRSTKTIITDSVKADYRIPIEFIGFDQGAVNVSSVGNVVLNGPVNNRNGNTSIASAAGSITQNADLPIVSGNNINLQAATGIGTPAGQPLLVNVLGGKLDATSNSGEVRVSQVLGDLKVGTVGGAGVSNVFLDAERNLLGWDANSYVQGRRVELSARNGGIGELSDTLNSPFIVRTGYSVNQADWPNLGLIASARESINVKNVADPGNAGLYSGNLLLISAESAAGDVRIETSGQVIDNNPFATTDQRTVQELADLWDSMRLRGQGAIQKADEQVASFENGKTQNYRLYWLIRERQADPSAYDSGFQYQVTATERSALTAQGMTAADISAFEANRTQQYHQLHAEVGGFTSAFNAGFRYDASAAEEAQIRNGSSWTDAQLALSIGGGLLKEITDTVTVIKQPNAKGRSVNLIAGTGIGSFDDPLTIDLSQGLDAITQEQKAALAAAERGDTSVNGQVITIKRPRPVNVDVGDLGKLLANAGTGPALLGSERDLRIDRIQAASEVRIKTAGSLIDAASLAGAVNVIGGNMIFEAANGGIGGIPDASTGAVESPLRFNAAAGSTVTARAAGGVWLEAEQDLGVDTMFSRGDLRLTAGGSIVAAFPGTELNLLSDNLVLTALTGSIGTAANPLDVGVNPDGTISASAATFGRGVYLNGPAGSSFNIGSLTSGDAMHLTSDTDLKITGPVNGPGAIQLIAGGDVAMTPGAHVRATTLGLFLDANTLTMSDGASLRIDVGTIDINTRGDAFVTGIFTGNPTESAIRITSGGRVLTGGNSLLDIIADAAPGTKLTIDAAGGIGNEPLQVQVRGLDASSPGNIHITEQDSLSIGTVKAGGEVLLKAGADVTGNSVAGKTVSVTSTGGSIGIGSATGDTVALKAPNRVVVSDNTIHVGTNMELAGSSISATVAHMGGPQLLRAALTGFDGGLADNVDVTLAGLYGIDFSTLQTWQGALRMPVGEFWSRASLVGDRLTFANSATSLVIDQHNKSLQPFDVQLYTGGAGFYLNVIGNRVFTNAQVVFRSPLHEIVTANGPQKSALEHAYDTLARASDPTPNLPQQKPSTGGQLISFSGTPVSFDENATGSSGGESDCRSAPAGCAK